MTYNVFMTVTPADNSHNYGISHFERAKLIAQRILLDNPDVVALQEVDPEEAKDAFVAELASKGPYKNFIRFIDEHNPLNDSGLMLFSKFPFAAPDAVLINGTILGLNEDVCEGESPLGTAAGCNVKIYDSYQSNGSDWWQNKGVATVRALNSCNAGEPINLVFTHTQSKGSPDDTDCAYGEDVADLQEQLTTIRELIEASYTGGSLLAQPTFLLGDLNLNGNQKGANRVTSQNRPFVITTTNPPSGGNPITGLCSWIKWSSANEWEVTFNAKDPAKPLGDANNGFYACRGNQPATRPCSHTTMAKSGTFFIDSWAYNTSREDPGQTQSGVTGGDGAFESPDEGERDDYILHNDPRGLTGGTRTLCMQYIRRGFARSSNELSDHLPVIADFNTPAPRCSMRPRTPGDPLLEAGDDGNVNGPARVVFNIDDPQAPNFRNVLFSSMTDPATRITNPGNMQWYVIDQPAAYRITTFNGPVAYEVFHSTDLSHRLQGANVECVLDPDGRSQQCTFSMLHPPYYIRVFAAVGANVEMPNRLITPAYDILFHRLDCSSEKEACPLEAGEPITAFWPPSLLNPADGKDVMWFSFWTEQAKSGTFPRNDFEIIHPFASQFASGNYIDPITPSLVSKGNVPITCPGCAGGFASQTPPPASFPSPEVTWNQTPDGFERLAASQPGTLPGDVGWPKKFFLTLARNVAYLTQQGNQTVLLSSTMTYFRPTELACFEERTDLGDDDLAFNFEFGPVQDGLRQIGAVNGDFETWEDGSWMGEPGGPQGAHAPFPFELDVSFAGDAGKGEHLDLNFTEDVIEGDNYWMCAIDEGGTCWNVFSFGDPIAALPAAEPDSPDPDKIVKYRWRDENGDDDWDYDYKLSYKVRHQRMPCRVASGSSQSDCPAGTVCSSANPAFATLNTSPRCLCATNQGCRPGQTCDSTTGTCK